ncbi:MAG: LapA family protein [Nitriliruptoraceae bacterium]|nr:LapA family protein [Nitriliruptoraceae bacterium]
MSEPPNLPDPDERSARGRPRDRVDRPRSDDATAASGPGRRRDGAARRGRTSAGEGATDPAAPDTAPVPLTQQIGRVAIVILAVLFGIFAVANSQPVDFSWIVGETLVREDAAGEGTTGGVPLIILLLVTFVIGGGLGALFEWYFLRSRRRRDRPGG